MNDELPLPELDDRELLAASAVLDGVADADERALVEERAHVAQWVASMRAVRDELADDRIVAPPPAVRESAIAAALAVFDQLQIGASEPVATSTHEAAPVSLADRRARRLARWNPRTSLGVAAAAVAVLAIGGIALNDRDSSGTAGDARAASDTMAKSADVADQPLPLTDPASDDVDAFDQSVAGAAPAEASDVDAAATEAAPAAPLDAGVAGGASADAASAETEAPADTEAPAATEAAAAAEAPASTTIGATGAVGGGTASTSAPLLEIADPTELAAYADDAVGDGTTAPCGPAGSQSLGTVDYAGTPASVTLDQASGAVAAYALDSCELLVSIVP